MKLYQTILSLVPLLAPAASFAPTSIASDSRPSKLCSQAQDDEVILDRRNMLKAGSFVMLSALVMELSLPPASAEEKIYSANARNLARLSNGDSSGGSVYDNNPTSPKARMRRAMVGCKNSSSRSLAGELIGVKNFNEKECNVEVMQGAGPDFMLEALTKLDCPTCPYGIGSR